MPWSYLSSASFPEAKGRERICSSPREDELGDRFAFVEGKKAEPAAIFGHNVWEVELHPEKVDWGRVMTARFVLKWTSDGRAKARLVLQGFGDPDLLRGELNTSSPIGKVVTTVPFGNSNMLDVETVHLRRLHCFPSG